MGRAWFLIDETAGLAIASGGSASSTLLVAGVFSYLAWVVGTVLGVLEQVPPMNDAPRSIPCPARHVLELRAGWVRAHGVAPGQRVLIHTALDGSSGDGD